MIAGNNDNDIGGDYENSTASTTFACKDCSRPIEGEPSNMKKEQQSGTYFATSASLRAAG